MVTLQARRTEGCLRMRRYSACTHMTSWMSEVRASAKKMEEKATWYDRLIVEHSEPSNWICNERMGMVEILLIECNNTI